MPGTTRVLLVRIEGTNVTATDGSVRHVDVPLSERHGETASPSSDDLAVEAA